MDNAGVDGEIFYTLREAQILIESWRRHFNTIRPHASFGYSCLHSPRGRLRYVNRRRRPCLAPRLVLN
jgi:transposase InsO family protein